MRMFNLVDELCWRTALLKTFRWIVVRFELPLLQTKGYRWWYLQVSCKGLRHEWLQWVFMWIGRTYMCIDVVGGCIFIYNARHIKCSLRASWKSYREEWLCQILGHSFLEAFKRSDGTSSIKTYLVILITTDVYHEPMNIILYSIWIKFDIILQW